MESPPARDLASFRRRLLAHYRTNRRALPWRTDAPDPYAIWICEVMAQQTQIERVVSYWRRWLTRFPDVRSLAEAPLADVLALWSGLGYYSRARALHRAAGEIVRRHDGRLPDDPELLRELPGIGPYTAGAIASIGFGRRAAAVDGNVMRVLARVFGVDDDLARPAGQRVIWALAESLLPQAAAGDFNQALFDLGATVCTPTSPGCAACPVRMTCVARSQDRVLELPRIERKTTVKKVVIDALAVRRGAALLLARRAPRGLYGGLWELPEASALPAARVTPTATLAEHVHKLTHRIIHYRVRAAELGAAPPTEAPPLYDAFRFVPATDLGELGISSATRTLALHIFTSWSSTDGQDRTRTRSLHRGLHQDPRGAAASRLRDRH